MRPFSVSYPFHSIRSWLAGSLVGMSCVLVGCGSSTQPDDAPVTVTATERTLNVHNGRRTPMFTFVVGRNASAAIDWYPCVDASLCPPIGVGERRSMTIHMAGQPETEALLYWWHATLRADGTTRPDSIRVMVVPLP